MESPVIYAVLSRGTLFQMMDVEYEEAVAEAKDIIVSEDFYWAIYAALRDIAGPVGSYDEWNPNYGAIIYWKGKLIRNDSDNYDTGSR